MNILLTSVGRRSYLVKYFKEALKEYNGKVHVANSTNISPAFNVADKCVVTPLIYSDFYISFLLKYCMENSINAIISLFDADLPILSKHKKEFENIGVKVLVSDEKVIHVCNDKWEMYNFMRNNQINVPKTYINIEDFKKDMIFPVILKPRWGMGSIGIYTAEDLYELNILYKKVKKEIESSYLKYESKQTSDSMVLIQEKLVGTEYGLDVINDLNGKYKNTIVKQKLAMRAGETDVAQVIKNDDLTKIGEKISKLMNHILNMDIDVFFSNGKFYILDMNARFGGGYPFSHIAGVNLPKAILRWLNNENVPESFFRVEIGVCSHKDIEIVKINK